MITKYQSTTSFKMTSLAGAKGSDWYEKGLRLLDAHSLSGYTPVRNGRHRRQKTRTFAPITRRIPGPRLQSFTRLLARRSLPSQRKAECRFATRRNFDPPFVRMEDLHISGDAKSWVKPKTRQTRTCYSGGKGVSHWTWGHRLRREPSEKGFHSMAKVCNAVLPGSLH